MQVIGTDVLTYCGLSVFVGHDREPCKNGLANWGVVWGPKESCIRWLNDVL